MKGQLFWSFLHFSVAHANINGDIINIGILILF